MGYVQNSESKIWQFKNIPQFCFGTMNPLFCSCGFGLSSIPDEEADDDSFMHTFFNVGADEIKEYVSLLVRSGFEKVFENNIDGNLFYQFFTEEGLYYISYMSGSKIARFILDRCKSSDVNKFGYSDFTNRCDDTVIAQYSLHYGEMIHGQTCDCGMNYVIRLRDNSLIIIDGGEFEQSTDVAVNDYLCFLHSLTGTQAGEKLKISVWICTHAHDDHCDFMSKIFRYHSEEVILERCAFNFPHPENTRNSPSISQLKKRLCDIYPHVKYIKLHAGSEFYIANSKITVLSSNEDAVCIDEDDPLPGTNDTSMIFTVEAEGVKALFLADCGDDNGSVLTDNYSECTLECDLLQAAHHGINKIYSVYEKIKSQKVLLPQCRMNMDTRFPEVYENFVRRFGENNICFAAESTAVFRLKNGGFITENREHVGTEYDNSQW